jgi:nucleoside-diphosphate-sugar epimerase
MRALVTGCAGFIGSNLTDRLLQDGYDVTGIDCFTDYYPRKIKEENISSALRSGHFTLVEKDILAIDEFPEVDVVFHQAAQAGVRASWGKSFRTYTRDNIETTQRLLEWYKDKPISKFVYASSSSIYGDAPLPMNIEARPQPISPYGVTKLAAEHLCYLYWKNFGVPTISLRYFTVYGPRQRPDMAINKFVSAVLDGKEITIYGDGMQTRDFTFISDIVSGNILAARCPDSGKMFNLGGGSRISVTDLIREIEKNCKKTAKITFIGRQNGDAADTLADIRYTSEYLGWYPTIPIEEGIKKYIEWRQKR